MTAAAQANKTQRRVELFSLFFVAPVLLMPAPSSVAFAAMYAVALLGGIWLYRQDRAFFRQAFSWRGIDRRSVARILLVFIFNALLLSVVLRHFQPEAWLHLPQEKPSFWLAVMVLYPLLSVIPQELVFRAFFMARYSGVFTGPVPLILANAISFSLAHLFLANWIAPTLTFIGGLLFAYTYTSRKSLLLVSFEHALYGNLLFTVGYGGYFY